jgi:hypothetical protein
MREALVRKVALLVVSVALAGALVISIPRFSAGPSTRTTMWKSGGGGSGSSRGFSWPMLRSSSSSAACAGSSGRSAGISSEQNPACRFDYPGPLRPESYDCYAEYFPLSQPFSFPEMATLPGRSFSLSGVTWADATVPRVPIVVLFKDRVSVLMETLRSYYRHLGTPYEVKEGLMIG